MGNKTGDNFKLLDEGSVRTICNLHHLHSHKAQNVSLEHYISQKQKKSREISTYVDYSALL